MPQLHLQDKIPKFEYIVSAYLLKGHLWCQVREKVPKLFIQQQHAVDFPVGGFAQREFAKQPLSVFAVELEICRATCRAEYPMIQRQPGKT